jgi:dihydropteroate synthase
MYENLISEINQFFEERVLTCSKAGINQNRIILDPGFGFGKTLNHNFEILEKFNEFSTLGLPLLAGLSRKSMFGQLLNRETSERVAASLAGALLCAQKGAHIIRVHDVKETADVIGVWQAATNGVTPL